MKFGCVRVTTHEQTHDLQQDALNQAGCERIFTDSCFGSVARADRPELHRLCEQMRRDDVLVVWRLDRSGRNLKDLLTFVNDLEAQGVQFISLTWNMDTTTTMGRLLFQIFGALAEYERGLIRERALAGAAAARARGRPAAGDDGGQALGRPSPHAGQVALNRLHLPHGGRQPQYPLPLLDAGRGATPICTFSEVE